MTHAHPLPPPPADADHAMLAAAFEASTAGLCFLDADGCIGRANSTLCRMLGRTHAELVGQHWTLLAPPQVAAHGPRFLAALPPDAPPFLSEWAVAHADGHSLNLQVSLRTLVLPDGTRRILASFTHAGQQRDAQDTVRHRARNLYREMVENAVEAIVVVQDERLVYGNPSALELSGHSADILFGLPFSALVHPDDLMQTMQRYQRRMAGLPATDRYAYFRILRPDGRTVWVESSAVRIDWDGRPAMLAFLSDQTERRRHELALTQSEERLKQSLDERDTVLENSIVGMVFLNPAGRVNWANGAMLQIFGCGDRLPVGESLERFYPSRTAYLETGAAVADAVRRGEPFETELQMRRADGSLFWAYLSGRAVNRTDMSRGTVWVVMDITRRRELEAALNKSEEHYRQVVDNVTECIFVVQDDHVVFANPRLSQLTGYTEADMQALPFMDAVHPEDRPQVRERQLRRLRGVPIGQHHQFRIVHRHSGAVIWVQLSSVTIEWEGRPATLSFMTDITERKRLEDSLRESVAERIRLETLQIQGELKEAELARRHAEETTRAKSMFLANMSHEIRTPMNAIIGMAHLALRTGLDARQREYLEKIHGAALSLLGIINDILDFSKIEAGRLDVEHTPFSLDDVFGNLAAVTAADAHRKNIGYRIQCPPEVPRALVGDPLRLGQVLINLVNNAVKFTERGEVRVACACLQSEAGRVRLQFIVHDTGIGMTEAQMQRLFQAFSQADESTTRRYGGTGLGLSIAKRLVELMGGEISVDSRPGIGTAIRFTAWFELGAQAVPAPALPAYLHDIAPVQRFTGLTVLLVEDNEINQQIGAEMLRAADIEVDIAANGAVALAMLEAAPQRYGMVFMDLQMPDMDGYEATCRIRADARFSGLPVVAMTAHAMVEERERCFAAGMNDHLAKPVDPARLYRTVARWCPRHMADEARDGPAPAADAAWPGIAGLDVQDGMRRALGDRDFYREMLERFRECHRGTVDEIRAALEQDRRLAGRLTHSLRGAAALLGAVPLRNLCGTLESGIDDGRTRDVLEPLLDEVEASLHALNAGIERAFPAAPPESAFTRAEATAALARLAALLRESDAEATECVVRSRAELAHALGSACYARLAHLTASYDFDAASALLAEAASEAGYTISGEAR